MCSHLCDMIRRVISEPDEMDVISNNENGDHNSNTFEEEEEPDTIMNDQIEGQNMDSEGSTPAPASFLVEPDGPPHSMQMEAPLTVIDPPMMRRNHDSNSTLSVDQEEEDEPLIRLEQQQKPPLPRTLHRTNSRSSSNSSQVAKSSQNSSRDWGWFEEIHFSDRPPNRSKKNPDQDGGLDNKKAHDHTDSEELGRWPR